MPDLAEPLPDKWKNQYGPNGIMSTAPVNAMTAVGADGWHIIGVRNQQNTTEASYAARLTGKELVGAGGLRAKAQHSPAARPP